MQNIAKYGLKLSGVGKPSNLSSSTSYFCEAEVERNEFVARKGRRKVEVLPARGPGQHYSPLQVTPVAPLPARFEEPRYREHQHLRNAVKVRYRLGSRRKSFPGSSLATGHFPDHSLRIWLALSRTRKWGK